MRACFALALLGLGAGCGGAQPTQAHGDLNFAVLGDAPYYAWEERRFEHLVDALDRDSLDWVIHVGDLFWKPCSAEKMRERLAVLQRIRHPVIYTPGDNEWTDCWGPREGGYAPLDRLDSLRAIYFPDPGASLGGRRMELETQARDSIRSRFVENRRWTAGGIVFATMHLVGSRNGRQPFEGRGPADDAEVDERTEAAAAWLRETFDRAASEGARAVVLATHAFTDGEYEPEYRAAYEPWLRALEEEVAGFERPVVLFHGDDHEFVVDRPLRDRRTGEVLENFTRVETMGSPDVGWVRVAVDTAGPAFRYQPYRVPGWKLW
ncbi:MAG: metallophosphoesterase [Gemmatimonadota bacterium]|nr:metallophosphoesterase [Gemmatimonadota bacterium]